MKGQGGMAGKFKGVHDTVEQRRVACNKVGLQHGNGDSIAPWGNRECVGGN